MNVKFATLTLALVLILSTTFGAWFTIHVEANPIPIPTLIMPQEYINVNISSVDGSLAAKVNGTYPFEDVNYTEVAMYYPVPPNASDISIRMNETSTNWNYSDKNYSTIIGNWPMINWTVLCWTEPTPPPPFWTCKFEIKTYYEHPLPLIHNDYMFLYAMGTGRFLETYAKNTTAYVKIRMETGYYDLHVYTVGNISGQWAQKPVSYSMSQEDTVNIILLNVTSQPFEPLKEDILLTFKTAVGGVGGESVPVDISVDKFGLLAPYIGLASTIIAATITTAIYVKHVKRRKEK